MPHSNFKYIPNQLDLGILKCSCGQTFDFVSERDMNMKLRMHRKFCSKLAEGSRQISAPMKAMTLREQQLSETKKTRRVHDHY